MFHYQLYILVLIGIGNASVFSKDVQALAADSFVESIGVNTHWTFLNVYTTNYTGLKAKLAESGIRYIRDGCSSAVRARIIDLYNDLGIRFNVIVERRKSGPGVQPINITAIQEALDEIKNQTLNAVVSFEAPNEYDLSHGPDTDWVDNIRNYTIKLSHLVKSDVLLRHIPIIAPSLTSREAYNAVSIMDPYIDYVNLHLYQWGYWPGNDGWDGKGAIPSITWYFKNFAQIQSPTGKLVQATETGYQDNLPNRGLSEIADGKYAVRACAEFFRRGIYRTFKYELIDQGIPGPEGSFGLLRNNLTEKSSFRAIKNLISILTDKGSSFQPDKLNYTLTGSTDNVRQILFQKHNGDFYLMIWIEVSCWNFTTQVDLYPSPQQVILTLPTTLKISNVILYAFNNTGDMNICSLSVINYQVYLNATDTITVVKLTNNTFHK